LIEEGIYLYISYPQGHQLSSPATALQPRQHPSKNQDEDEDKGYTLHFNFLPRLNSSGIRSYTITTSTQPYQAYLLGAVVFTL
jgi:hypothetical protein